MKPVKARDWIGRAALWVLLALFGSETLPSMGGALSLNYVGSDWLPRFPCLRLSSVYLLVLLG